MNKLPTYNCLLDKLTFSHKLINIVELKKRKLIFKVSCI